MDKVGMPRGLIRYTTQNALDGGRVRVLRPRILVYAALLVVLVAAWSWGVANRSPLIADVLRDRNALYQLHGDRVDNSYTLKLVNKTDADQVYRVRIEAKDPSLALGDAPVAVRVRAGEVLSQAIQVGAPASIHGRHPLVFVVEAADGSAAARVDSSFFGPM
jgi:polyferredoxin